ncbi:MAG: exopolysaccharide biosynthesis polyprenyl glycosylphosphotransferase [Microcoleaceae cyanobacterium]
MIGETPGTNIEVIYDENTIPVVILPVRFTVVIADSFRDACRQLFSQNPRKIVIDFHHTSFIDSCGIGALVTNLKTAKEKNIDFILTGVNSQVMAVFSMTGLNQVLTIENSHVYTSGDQINRNLPMTHPSVRSWLKRTIDIVGALVGLSITSVLFVPVVIAIKLDSPGPIFFGQVRCGWMGKKFKIWKFRSMCMNAEALKQSIPNQAEGAIFKNDKDPRVTKVGNFLRRSSLDELPQFWNVLIGDMSLVGTRPPTPDEVERYEVPQWQRLDVKPGMTGEWQVNGRSQIKNFADVIRLDLKYQENWSLWYDIKLILKTIIVVFNKNSGAV